MQVQKSLKELARLVQGQLVNLKESDDVCIVGVGSLEHALQGHISFLADDRYLPHLEHTKASAVIVSEKLNSSIPQLIVSNPKLVFAKVLSLFSVFPSLPTGLSPYAFKEADVSLGNDISVGPFVYVGRGAFLGDRVILYPGVFVGAGVSIGDDSVIYPNVTLYPSVSIGKRVIVHGGTVLGSDGFGYVFDGKGHQKIPQVGRLLIEDDVEIGANSAVDRAALDTTKIGCGTKIDNLVQIGHNCQLGPLNILCGQVGLGGGVQTGKGVIFGGQVGSADQVVIPDGTRFAAQTGIRKSFKLEPYQDYFGTPAHKAREFFKSLSIFSKLPDIYKRLKLLEKKVSHLLDKSPQV